MSADAGDFLAIIRMLIAQATSGREPVEGIVYPGSWNPSDSTIQVVIGTTGTLDDGATPADNQVLNPTPIPLLNTSLNAQGGPVGLERVILLQFEGGPIAILKHDADDSPGVPSGEHHTYLRSSDRGTIVDSFVKVQSDATRLGHEQKVSVLSPIVVLGADEQSDDLAIVRLGDLQNATNAIIASVQSAMDALCERIQPGSGVAPPAIGSVTPTASETSYTA
jgi:hypothetical protein